LQVKRGCLLESLTGAKLVEQNKDQNTDNSSGNGRKAGTTHIDQEPVFYYSREHRLEHASPAVRALNEQRNIPFRKTIFSGNAAVKPMIMIFGTVVLLAVTGFIMGISAGGEKGRKLGSNTIAVSALRYRGSTYIAIKKTCDASGDV
jgi:hypothetical protein